MRIIFWLSATLCAVATARDAELPRPVTLVCGGDQISADGNDVIETPDGWVVVTDRVMVLQDCERRP